MRSNTGHHAEDDVLGEMLLSLQDNTTWSYLYHILRPPIRRWVYNAHVPSWSGQQEDITDDIIQETFLRLLRYYHKLKQEQGTPIQSLPQFCKKLAWNYCLDLQRHDQRLVSNDDPQVVYIHWSAIAEDPQETVVERAYEEELFARVVDVVVTFPSKQQKALLTDLASRMDFHGTPSPLQKAFAQRGVRLEEYCQPPSRNARERNRYWTSLSTAYKRLRKLLSASEDTLTVSQKKTRQQKILAKESILSQSHKKSAQSAMFLVVSSSLIVESNSPQRVIQLMPSRCETLMREITIMDRSDKELPGTRQEQDVAAILHDPELARLALYLRQTPPSIIDSVYRDAFPSMLTDEGRPQKQQESGAEMEDERKAGMRQEDVSVSINEPENVLRERNEEQRSNTMNVEQSHSSISIDSHFQEIVLEKLLEAMRSDEDTPSKMPIEQDTFTSEPEYESEYSR